VNRRKDVIEREAHLLLIGNDTLDGSSTAGLRGASDVGTNSVGSDVLEAAAVGLARVDVGGRNGVSVVSGDGSGESRLVVCEREI
jgi:hypothetical protein